MYYDPKNTSLVEVEYVTPAYGARHVTGLYDGTTLEEINPKGVLVQPGTLIEWTEPEPPNPFCTPLYSELPVSYPPYECGTEVNTAGVTDFTDAWRDCSELTEFPCLDTSSGTNFNFAWAHTGLTTIPLLNTSNGETFNYSFYYARDLGGTFPLWDFSSAQVLKNTWTVWDGDCAPLQFASGCFESLTKNFAYFGYSFYGRQLTEESWDNIFSSLDASGTLCGYCTLWEEAAPSFVQDANEGALFNLYAKGWTAITYDGYMYELFPLTNYECSTEVDTAGVVNFTDAWNGCTELTEFPELDLSSGRVFYRTWAGCTGLTGFPDVDVSNGTNFTLTWSGCSDLSEFPVLDVSNGVTFDGTWRDCNSLASFPELDLSSGTNFNNTWRGCTSLTSFPALDLSSGTTFINTWFGCTSLTSFPELDLSSGTDFNGSWYGCNSLTSFPALDLSSGKEFGFAWFGCSSLTSFPALDLSSGTNFNNTWRGCTSLTSFPEIDLSSGTTFNQAWQSCSALTSFPANMFDTCTATNFSSAWSGCALTEASVDNILVSLDTAGQSNGTVGINGGTSSAPGTAGAAAKASLIAKGWTVTTN